FREYSLAPDTDALQLNLTIRNDGNIDLSIDQAYVGMAMNRGLRHWVDKSGFDFDFSDLARVNTSAGFYAAVGERVSYSVLNLAGAQRHVRHPRGRGRSPGQHAADDHRAEHGPDFDHPAARREVAHRRRGHRRAGPAAAGQDRLRAGEQCAPQPARAARRDV